MKLAAAATVFLIGASAWAQDAPAAASQDQSGGQAAQQPEPEYGGPSLLSRGGTASVFRRGDLASLASLRPFLGVTGVYGSDLGGSVVSQAGYGVSGMFGVTGTHVWSHSVLDLDYHGSYRNYSDYAADTGLDNSLSFGFEHQFTSRLVLSLNENLARLRSAYSLPLGGLYGGGMSGYSPLYNSLVQNNLLDTPTLASVGGARLMYQLTARWSISAGGTGFIARQHAAETLGVNGYAASGDAAYRLNRYQTISFGYSFTHFGYEGQFGQTDLHSGDVSYSVRLGRHWELATMGGVSRAQSLRSAAVALDPVLAQLLGFSVVFEKVHDVFYMPSGGVRLTRAFRHSSWRASYDRSVVAGNGLYGTSNYESAGTAYSFSALRRLSLQAGASYDRYSAMTQSLGRYRSFGAGCGFDYPIAKGFSSVARIDWRRYSVSGSSLDRRGYYASFGLAWSPGSYPLALW